MTDDEQTTAFANVPAVKPTRDAWVCAKCGNDVQSRVRPDPTRPSIDPRYALGTCDDCSPVHKTPKGPARERIQLVRASGWNRQLWIDAQARKAEAKLLKRYRRGDVLTPEEIAEVRSLIGRTEK